MLIFPGQVLKRKTSTIPQSSAPSPGPILVASSLSSDPAIYMPAEPQILLQPLQHILAPSMNHGAVSNPILIKGDPDAPLKLASVAPYISPAASKNESELFEHGSVSRMARLRNTAMRQQLFLEATLKVENAAKKILEIRIAINETMTRLENLQAGQVGEDQSDVLRNGEMARLQNAAARQQLILEDAVKAEGAATKFLEGRVTMNEIMDEIEQLQAKQAAEGQK